MCPTHPVSLLTAIVDHPHIPDDVKDGIKPLLNRSLAADQTTIGTVSHAKVTQRVDTTPHFHFSIYSMHGKKDKAFKHDELLWDTTGHKSTAADPARDKCHLAFGWTWKLYHDAFNRNSLDNKGIEMVASIHWKTGVADASWDTGAGQMFFGDGGIFDEGNDDGRRVVNLGPYMIDVVGHELTHGVVSFTAPGLDPSQRPSLIPAKLKLTDTVTPPHLAKYRDQMIALAAKSSTPELAEQYKTMLPAALEQLWINSSVTEASTLNEHIADSFGIMVKHFSLKQSAAQGSWNIADGWWTAETMAKREWDPTKNYQRTFRDVGSAAEAAKQPDEGPRVWSEDLATFPVGDVHLLASIPNHAFFLAATKFGGNTWENVGRIWYAALRDAEFKDKVENQTFKGWRDVTVKQAGLLFASVDGKKKMEEAWRAVGL